MKLVTLILVLLASQTAWAQEFRDVLRSIDTIPTRAQLDASYPDARERLEAAAGEATGYERDRAITLLSLYPDTRTRAFLEGLLGASDGRVRQMAVYTLGRTFGTGADARLVAVIVALVEDADVEVAKWAVRALRWVDHRNATRKLEELAQNGPHAEIARRSLRHGTQR